MQVADIQSLRTVIQRHNQRNVLDAQVMVLTKDVDETLAHVAIDAALYGVVDWRYAALYLKKDIKKPSGILVEVLPVGNKHVIANRLVAVVHGLLKGRQILRRTLLDDLAKHLPVLCYVITAVLLSIAHPPMARNRQNDIVMLKNVLQVGEIVGLTEEFLRGGEMLVWRKLWPLSLEIEVATVVIQPNDVCSLEVFPCPVMAGQLAEVRILLRNIVTLAIGLIARNSVVECSPCLYGQEIRVLWQLYLLVCTDKNLDVTHYLFAHCMQKYEYFLEVAIVFLEKSRFILQNRCFFVFLRSKKRRLYGSCV